MKFFPTLLLVLIGAFWSPSVSQASDQAKDHILSFDSHVAVKSDGTLQVTERIEVDVKGEIVKHGIFRNVITEYRDGPDNNRPVKASFDVVSVARDGKTEPYMIETIENGTRLRIGRGDVLLPEKPTTYEVRYRTKGFLRRQADRDELVWSTGDRWAMPIDTVRLTVDAPPGADFLSADAVRDCTICVETKTTRSKSSFTAQTTLLTGGPGSELIVSVSWPKGFVTPATQAQ